MKCILFTFVKDIVAGFFSGKITRRKRQVSFVGKKRFGCCVEADSMELKRLIYQ